MERNIEKKFDFSKYSVPVLLTLYKANRDVRFEKKAEILPFLVQKYFEDKTSIDIYGLFTISNGIYISSKVDKVNFCLNVLNKEFQTSYQPMPMEYQEHFFTFLIATMDMVEKMLKENDGSIEWHLSEIPALIEYLNRMDKNSIKAPSLRQRINELVSNIKEEYEKAEKAQTTALQIVGITKESLDKIPHFKLQKSKMTKRSSIVDALKTFRLYNEEDKFYLINLIKKKNWKDLFWEIDSIDAFDYLRNHTDTVFNMWEGFFASIAKSNFSSDMVLQKWYEYFEVENLGELYETVKSLYLSFEGATERGFNAYWEKIISRFIEDSHARLTDNNQVMDFMRVYYKQKFQDEISYFCNYPERDLISVVIAKEVKRVEMTKLPMLVEEDGKQILTEYIFEIPYYISDLDYFFEFYTRYSGVFFEYQGMTLETEELKVLNSDNELYSCVSKYIQFLSKIRFVSSDIITLAKQDYKHIFNGKEAFYQRNYGDSRFIGQIYTSSENLNYYFRWAFCRNSSNITNDFIREIWFDGHIDDFFKLIPLHTYSGFYQNREEYSYFFFNRLKEELDFGKVEDVRKLFYLSLPYGLAGQFGLDILGKFKKESPECYELIEYTLEEEMTKHLILVFDCIKAYYGIKD